LEHIPQTGVNADHGHVLLSTVGFLTVVSLILVLLGTAADYSFQIIYMQSLATESYWLAKSQAVYALSELTKHSTVDTQPLTLANVAGHEASVTTQMTLQKATATVTVSAAVGTARHTVTFSYNENTSALVTWVDSDVPPQ